MSNPVVKSLIDTWHIVPGPLIIMFISLYAAQVLIETGLFKRMEFIGRPLVMLAHLPQGAGITFMASFGSVLAGNAMTARLYQEKRIDRTQTLLTALLNTTPVYVKEIFTYQIPVMIPLLGIKVGFLYFLTFIASGLIKILFVMIYGRVALKDSQPGICPVNVDSRARRMAPEKKIGDVLVSSFSRQKNVFFKVSAVFIATTFLIFLLINTNSIAGVSDYVGPLTDFFKLPSSCVLPIATYMFSPLVGASSIGAMLKDGMLNDLQGITACLLGSLLMLPVFTLRYSFARYISIFGFSLGTTILSISTGLGMLNRGAFLFFFLCMS
ncbi:MAG: hypothetical protein HQ551_10220 [Desulfobacteraceae bacterium]|nr:hypothetical protein [Desulfobacteraceae bacterium]